MCFAEVSSLNSKHFVSKDNDFRCVPPSPFFQVLSILFHPFSTHWTLGAGIKPHGQEGTTLSKGLEKSCSALGTMDAPAPKNFPLEQKLC